MRLNRFLASCGVGSRRSCEEWIRAGRVMVDGAVVRDLGVTVEPSAQEVRVDGRPVRPQRLLYLMFNKPRDVLCTSRDPRGRRTFYSCFPDLAERVFTVGRLDRNSEGLLLVTNDGDLAQLLMHPRHHVVKRYDVRVPSALTREQRGALTRGVLSDGERLSAEAVACIGTVHGACRYEVRLREGRNRQIRRMFQALGVAVLALKRVAIGPLEIGDLRTGAWRHLTADEVRRLRETARRDWQESDRMGGQRR